MEPDKSEEYPLILPGIGDGIRASSGGKWLPTQPGTYIEIASAHKWSSCALCRVMAKLHMWRIRDKHISKRHTPRFAYLDIKSERLY